VMKPVVILKEAFRDPSQIQKYGYQVIGLSKYLVEPLIETRVRGDARRERDVLACKASGGDAPGQPI
jgi:hypothetical protein